MKDTNKQNIEVELKKATPHIIVEIIEYMPNAVVNKTILKKTTGNITVSSVDAGEEVGEKTLPFDNYIQIIDGGADVTINKKLYKLRVGEGITIPAHATQLFNASVQFKMISSIIKSGYEEWIQCNRNSNFIPALENILKIGGPWLVKQIQFIC